MKIMHILATSSFSGAENVVCQITDFFKEEIEMIYVSPQGSIKDALQARGVTYIPIQSLSMKEIHRVIKEEQPDMIQAHDRKATLVAVLTAKKIPIITHLHARYEDMSRWSLKSLVYTLCLFRVKKIICVSKSVRDASVFYKYFRNKILVLRNVIESEKLQKQYQTNIVNYDIAFIGRLEAVKNIALFLEIAKEISRLKKEVKIVICGKGPLQKDIIQCIQEYHLEKNIIFKGFVNNPLTYLSQSKMLVITSFNEGTPMVALESFALGKPIIATPIDGLQEIIVDGKNGYLCSDVLQFIEAIVLLMNENRRYQEICSNVKQLFHEINNAETYTEELAKIYLEVCGET